MPSIPAQPYDPNGTKPTQHYDPVANSVSQADLSAAVEMLQEQIDSQAAQIAELKIELAALKPNT